ncbi:sugar transferase [Microbacterium marinum]|uniref:sugar transferase n=1 Tax=Microbacterium marinum TaxID=421115 RepID=UPI00384E558B
MTDLILIALCVFGTQLAWFASLGTNVVVRPDSAIDELSYSAMSAVLVVAWMWALALSDSRAGHVVGVGTIEYRRVADASLRLFGAVAIVAFILRVDVARGYLLIALPLGVVLLEASRWLWRQWLVRQRHHGRFAARVLLLGSERSVTEIAAELRRQPGSGYVVVGACVPRGRSLSMLGDTAIPVYGSVDDVDAAMLQSQADTVAITSTDDLPAAKVKEVSWNLEAGRQHLVLAPSIIDVAGPRIHAAPLAGLPLIHVGIPHLSAGQRLLKRLADIIVSTVALIVLSPLLAMLAMLVRRSTPGPALFRQVRVGRHGRTFMILKFRTMVADAEDRFPALSAAGADAGNEVLFKLRDDPRVTPIGRFLRRHSLDELPQLVNVLTGSMSLVGPRPPLPSEAARYDDHVHRRFLMKPGMTGMWQVSGRSLLSWEDSVRLDLSYVENYSLVGDVLILLKTVKTVFSPGDGAF